MSERTVENNSNRPDELLRFYKSYFIDYWEVKYKLLKYEIDNFETQKERLSEINGLDTILDYEKKCLSIYKLDLHFMKFQIIESLFSFIFALEKRDDKFLWYNLSFPRCDYIKNYPYDRISELNNHWKMKNYLDNMEDGLPSLWEHLFFFKVDITQIDKDFNLISENICNILVKLAWQLKDRDDYNAYKHSLRCLHFSNTYMSISTNNKNWIPAGFAKNSLNILDSNVKDGNTWINIVSKSFSIKEDSFFIEKSLEMMKNIMNTRISHFFNEELEEIHYFENIECEFHNEYSIISQSRSITSINTLHSLGMGALQEGYIKLAKFYFEKVIQVENKHYDSLFRLGYCHYTLDEYSLAIKYYKKYEKNGQAPHYIENLYNLALSYYNNQDYENADINFGRFLRKCEEDNNSNLRNDDNFVKAKYLRVDSKLKLNQKYFEEFQKNETNKYVNPAEEILNTIDDKDFRNPKIWYSVALLEFNLKRYDKSKKKIKKLIKYQPDNPEYLNFLARIYCGQEKFDKMEEILMQSLHIDEENFYTWNAINMLRRKVEDKDGIFEACEKSLKYSKNNEQRKIAFNNFGDYYNYIEDYEKAVEYFKQSLGIDKTFKNAVSGLIDSLWALERFDEIVNNTNDLEYNHNNALILNRRAYALSEIDEIDKALDIFEHLIPEIEDDNKLLTLLFDSKGDMFRKKGDIDNAIIFYNKSLNQSEKEYYFIAETKQKLKECQSELELMEQ